jgi:hypothetical protein
MGLASAHRLDQVSARKMALRPLLKHNPIRNRMAHHSHSSSHNKHKLRHHSPMASKITPHSLQEAHSSTKRFDAIKMARLST